MLLTISTTHQPATDLGFLLHKNPDKMHEVDLAFGKVVMAYPEASDEKCTFAMTLDVDPISLVRGKNRGQGLLDQYVNDRPYAAASFFSVAIARALNTAFAGRSKNRQELADSAIPFSVVLTPVPARGSDGVVERLFQPLGYNVETQSHLLDDQNPDWGDSAYVTLTLSGKIRLQDLLTHLYVLLPVLDNSKHYYVDQDEVDKLLKKGESWLADHPEKDFIVSRYLKRRGGLVRDAQERLEQMARLTDNAVDDVDVVDEKREAQEEALEKPIRLNDLRMEAVAATLAEHGAKKIIDLGCGEGKLLRVLLSNKQFTDIVGVDASLRALDIAERRLRLDQMSERQRQRITLMHGALTYRDRRLENFDAAALVEVIEHIDPDRLPALERAIFEFSKPGVVIVTTPNREYNALFENMPEGKLRHGDHRFEWTRAEFQAWATKTAETFGYEFEISFIGEEDENYGAPTQMAVFERCVS